MNIKCEECKKEDFTLTFNGKKLCWDCYKKLHLTDHKSEC